MTRTERVGMWLLVAGLVVLSYGVSLRMDTLDRSVTRLAAPSSTSTSSTSTTTTPLAAEVQTLQRQVLQLQANRGLTGPEVRALVETLLPEETCSEPPCGGSPTTTVATAPTGAPPSSTTEQQRRRR